MTECELSGGGWACSEACYDKAVAKGGPKTCHACDGSGGSAGTDDPCSACHGDEYAQPCAECGAGKLPGEEGFRPEVYRREIESEVLRRCIAAVEAMPDFAGRTTRPDGLTHRCDKCGEWMAATSVRRNVISGVVHHERQDRLGSVKCGTVHDLSPVEGVLRSDVIALLRRVMKEDQHE